MNFFGQSKVRRFGVSKETGMIVCQFRNRVKELCEVPGGINIWELQQRIESLNGRSLRQLSGRRYDSDIIATTPEGVKVSTIQIENVYNDWLLLSAVCGVGTYEHVANAHELQVLAIARKMFGE